MCVRFFVLAPQSPLGGSWSSFNKLSQGKVSRTFTYLLPQFVSVALFLFIDIFGSEVTIAIVFPSVPGVWLVFDSIL